MSTLNKDVINAINFVRDNIKPFEIEEGWHYIANRQPLPSSISNKIYDLLEEYGDDNDLPEGWWENYCELEDFFMEL